MGADFLSFNAYFYLPTKSFFPLFLFKFRSSLPCSSSSLLLSFNAYFLFLLF
jgi:hypothetical protein